MTGSQDTLRWLYVCGELVSGALALVLAGSARALVGRRWLMASAAFTLASLPAMGVVEIVANAPYPPPRVIDWFEPLNLLLLVATACLGMFLLSAWSASRMELNTRDLLFSFSGRIPRSVFWIVVCIMFPLGRLVVAPLVTEARGLPVVITWVLSATCWVLVCWISLALCAKRWHDCGKSGWMSLGLLVPVIGSLWVFGYCGLTHGETGPNRFGDALTGRESE
jgi:uncharacterized membrane protein YhaH (DUF805 family)